MGIFDWFKSEKDEENFKSKKKKIDQAYESPDMDENSNESVNMQLDISVYPESTIKNINDLDDEKKKQLMDVTIFIDKDGYFDETRGQAKIITKGLDFLSKVKGIKSNEINFDLRTFSKASDELPPFTDEDGNWHVKNGNRIEKYFSEHNFRASLKELLDENNIDEKDVEEMISAATGIGTKTYEGDGFNIEIITGSYPDFVMYGKDFAPPFNKNAKRVIQVVTTEELPSQGIGYIHIEGKGLFTL